MEVTRIEEGLWRWTAPHPDWTETDDWPQDVGCVYWEAEDAIVLVDPLVPRAAADRERLLDALDRDVERVGRDVAVLLTCEWHARSAEELAGRYGGRVHTAFAKAPLPGGIESIEVGIAEEVVYWLPGARSVVPGDVLLGSRDGVRMCPESWLGGRGGIEQLRTELAPLLDLPIERVLTSHGPPVLTDGRAALAQALALA